MGISVGYMEPRIICLIEFSGHPIRQLHHYYYYATADWTPWAYCKDEHGCGRNARIDIAAIVARTGDMPADRFRRRLRCSKCGKRARLVIGHR
jgi:hypothetical protein